MSTPIFSEENRNNVLIVGANGGIGFGFVNALLQEPSVHRVIATYRNPETARELLALEQTHSALACLPLDICDEDQIERAIAHISSIVPQLHLVINCVGILHEGDLQPEKSLRQITPEYLMRYFQVNSIGAVLLAKHLMPLFKRDRPSVFATISAKIGSIEDNRLGGWYGYRASKAALNMFLKTASIEYSRRCPKTIITLLHPGTTDSKLSEPFQRNVPPEKLFSVERTVAQLLDIIRQLTPKDNGSFFSWDGRPLPW
ncbi:MAG: SDR family NAD(P)-dependent oxidoreductase [Leptolyngbyaceae bacterium]|nr:SDR family NAD(P)-dependent oxidoreductase [Leptolyngbyaceae bacterium]